MSKKTESARFTKVTSKLLLGVKDLAEWGIDTGNTTQDALRACVLKHDAKMRREAAIKMIEAGNSQRTTAKLLGVSYTTIQNDVTGKLSKSDNKVVTGSAATKAHRAKMAVMAAAGGITPAPTEKVRILYADCPWDYGAHAQPDYHTEQRDHYPVMTLEELCALPVKDWLADDAVAFIWTTSPMLEKSFALVHAWGVEYKSTFIWDKIKHNMAHYNSMRHEILLICTRGACRPDVKELIDSVQSIERGKHSEKPVEFYDIIETLYTHGRKLEMFGRKRREGWDIYGHPAQIAEAAE